ncbi:hypothetical protein [Legionella sp. km772]|uniref:hypothetical protein n=1 Tax=Legionella sp. km772 TaxID=2498111 RepID=UPI000F8F156D|nr:hypothetical protein [Legionella sp. km772]RUR12497.1 hypothetical protein ELY15_04955 [Legionella sp. km772]
MKNNLLLTLLMLNGSLSYAANDHSESLNFPKWNYGHFILQAGGFWAKPVLNQHVNIADLIGDEFRVNKSTRSNGLIGIGYYLDGHNFKRTQFSYGINAFYLPKTSVSGVVVQENLFTNLSYKYNTTSFPLFAIAKTSTKLAIERLSLTVDAGIGPNFIKTNGFIENPLDGITIPDYVFTGHTTTTFSATVGAGLQVGEVFGSMPLECGYRFFYLGKGQLSKVNDQIIDNLNTGSTYANAVICNLKII